MIYLGLAFILAFTLFFVREIALSMRRGFVSSRGWTAHRDAKPVQFWTGIAAWVLNASVGFLFFFALLELVFDRRAV